MLRVLVLLFLLVNAGLWWWLQDNPQALQADREPQRLNHQVRPDAIQVLPDLPAASAPAHAGSAASADAGAASAAEVALAAAPAVATLVASPAALAASATGLARP